MKDQINGYKSSNETNGDAAPTVQKAAKKQNKQNEQQDQPQPQEQKQQHFVDRVSSLPVVRDGYDKARLIADMTFLSKYGLKAVNTTVSTLSHYASQNEPMQRYYHHYIQPHVERADSLGCRSLDYIQTRVPLINEPSSKIIDDVRARLDSTVKTVSHPVEILARSANKGMTSVVDNIEGIVDSYFPPPRTTNNNNNTETRAHENGVAAREDNVRHQNQQTEDIVNNASPNGVNNVEQNQVRRLYEIMKQVPSRVSHQVQRSTDEILHFFHEHSLSGGKAAKSNDGNTEQPLHLQDILSVSIGRLQYLIDTRRLPRVISSPMQYSTSLATGLFGSMREVVQDIKMTASARSAEAAEAPTWLKNRLSSTLQTTNKQLQELQQDLVRKDSSYTEKVAIVMDKLWSQLKLHVDHGNEKGQFHGSHSHNHQDMDQKTKSE